MVDPDRISPRQGRFGNKASFLIPDRDRSGRRFPFFGHGVSKAQHHAETVIARQETDVTGQQAGALAHVFEPAPQFHPVDRRQTLAIVADDHHQMIAILAQMHGDRAALGMFDCIGNAFLHDAAGMEALCV